MATVFEIVSKNVGIVALFFSTWLIVLSANREIFEPHSTPMEAISPLGDTKTYIPWRYRSRYADEGRILLGQFVRGFYYTIAVMVTILAFSFVSETLLSAGAQDTDPAGLLHTLGQWWIANVQIRGLIGSGIQYVVVVLGPTMFYFLSRVCYLVIRAREDFRETR